MAMKNGHFMYCFKLWFEDTDGKQLALKEPTSIEPKQPITRDFYKKLQGRLFSQRTKCFELYSLYLGFLPSKVLEQNNQALIALLLGRQLN